MKPPLGEKARMIFGLIVPVHSLTAKEGDRYSQFVQSISQSEGQYQQQNIGQKLQQDERVLTSWVF